METVHQEVHSVLRVLQRRVLMEVCAHAEAGRRPHTATKHFMCGKKLQEHLAASRSIEFPSYEESYFRLGPTLCARWSAQMCTCIFRATPVVHAEHETLDLFSATPLRCLCDCHVVGSGLMTLQPEHGPRARYLLIHAADGQDFSRDGLINPTVASTLSSSENDTTTRLFQPPHPRNAPVSGEITGVTETCYLSTCVIPTFGLT